DAGDSGIYLRGIDRLQVNLWSQELGSGELNNYRKDKSLPQELRRFTVPLVNADRPFGQWNGLRVTLEGSRITVDVNGTRVIEPLLLPDVPPRGPIALQHHGDRIEFRNIWVRPLPTAPGSRSGN